MYANYCPSQLSRDCPRVLRLLRLLELTLVPKPGGGLALPEPLESEDAKSWFKRYEVYATANGWNDPKKLLCLPALLKGRSWAVYDSLREEDTDAYEHLKAAILRRLCPDTEKDRLVARKRLSQRRLKESESIDEL